MQGTQYQAPNTKRCNLSMLSPENRAIVYHRYPLRRFCVALSLNRDVLTSMSRVVCPDCQNPPARCFCDLLSEKLEHQTPVLIWQHPQEANHPKGTAKLLHMGLSRCQLMVATHLSEEEILRQCHNLLPDSQPVLLFPGGQSVEPVTATLREHPVTLIILDGTWRKARRLFYENPWLAHLPRISLAEPTSGGGYHIRKAEKPGQLSTLEACCYALDQLERQPGYSAQLLALFDRYMDRLGRLQNQHKQ